MQQRIILILEEYPATVERFEAALGDAWQVIHRPNVAEMIGVTKNSLASADILSLDHDLDDPAHPDVDPGDRLEFVRWLVDQKPARPVIIHSSNTNRARIMIGDLDLAKWTAQFAMPISDDWAENDWRTMVNRLVQP